MFKSTASVDRREREAEASLLLPPLAHSPKDAMILTTELPQELLHRLRDAPLRLSAMRSALLAANLEGVWWGSRSVPGYTPSKRAFESGADLGNAAQDCCARRQGVF